MRVLTCNDCGDPVEVYEEPREWIDPALYRCGLCTKIPAEGEQQRTLKFSNESRSERITKYDPAQAAIPYGDPEGESAKRDEAIRRVDAAADEETKQTLRRLALRVASMRREFTTDPIHYLYEQEGNPEIREPRVLGPIMLQLQAEGKIRSAGRQVPSRRRHRGYCGVWESLVYAE